MVGGGWWWWWSVVGEGRGRLVGGPCLCVLLLYIYFLPIPVRTTIPSPNNKFTYALYIFQEGYIMIMLHLPYIHVPWVPYLAPYLCLLLYLPNLPCHMTSSFYTATFNYARCSLLCNPLPIVPPSSFTVLPCAYTLMPATLCQWGFSQQHATTLGGYGGTIGRLACVYACMLGECPCLPCSFYS